MAKYRRKPVVIEAIQWTGYNTFAVVEFIEGKAPDISHYAAHEKWDEYCQRARVHGLTIKTLEDGADGRAKHVASPGDWVIRGVKGEHWPIKPDIFAATYEQVDA